MCEHRIQGFNEPLMLDVEGEQFSSYSYPCLKPAAQVLLVHNCWLTPPQSWLNDPSVCPHNWLQSTEIS